MTTNTQIKIVMFRKLLQETDDQPTVPGVRLALFEAFEDEGTTPVVAIRLI